MASFGAGLPRATVDVQQMLRPVRSMRTGLYQLPPAIDDFTGREETLRAVTQVLEHPDDRAKAGVVSAIAGQAGVGKTALATKVAHTRRRARGVPP